MNDSVTVILRLQIANDPILKPIRNSRINKAFAWWVTLANYF